MLPLVARPATNAAFASVPPVLSVTSSTKVEYLDISIQITRPASPQLVESPSDDAPDFLTEKRVPMLQRFFHLVIGESSCGFPGTPAELLASYEIP